MKTIEVYKTSDDQIFRIRADALNHEKTVNMGKALTYFGNIATPDVSTGANILTFLDDNENAILKYFDAKASGAI